MDKISWADRVDNEEILHRVKEDRNILQILNRRKGNRIGHILSGSCLLKHVTGGKIEGKIEVTGRRERRLKQLLVYLKEKRRLWKLEEEAPYRTLWRTRFGRCHGPVVRQTAKF